VKLALAIVCASSVAFADAPKGTYRFPDARPTTVDGHPSCGLDLQLLVRRWGHARIWNADAILVDGVEWRPAGGTTDWTFAVRKEPWRGLRVELSFGYMKQRVYASVMFSRTEDDGTVCADAISMRGTHTP
jgi:hypothetical protein